jgi:hypothetical protein
MNIVADAAILFLIYAVSSAVQWRWPDSSWCRPYYSNPQDVPLYEECRERQRILENLLSVSLAPAMAVG